MKILFNDKLMQCEEDINVTALLKQLRQLKPGIALSLNKEILPRDQWDLRQVHHGDHILLFQVIAGG